MKDTIVDYAHALSLVIFSSTLGVLFLSISYVIWERNI